MSTASRRHPDGFAAPATVQLTVSRTDSGKTAVRAHVEKLADSETRERMRERWRAALERVIAEL